MTRHACGRAGGLSLVELLVVLAIATLVLAPLAQLLSTAGAAAAASSGRLALEREAGFAFERMSAVARAAPSATLDPVRGGGTRSGDWFDVEFEHNGDKLMEKGSGSTRVLARDVAAFSIAAPQQDGQQLLAATMTIARAGYSHTASMSVRVGGPR